ncbi:hypothetical protein Dsin_014206 [Dipteronia sinensis]|uniref:ADP-ribosyl cyclase/cyclic ADP-ribose hydrolase n=1 Tax=Dipteronia sinensis TaxID=43782 RepID=A0AAE0E9Q2_9ROSI|nr:hypothetical protein Dsin_014206 [Dipteronia sinensis]
MASCSNTKFDVFLSFRGEDTRYTFTSHLHAALCRRKIQTFIDYDLRKGDEISPALEKTIEDSCLSIIILSENYASSTWCLNELVKILECKKAKGQIVLPVFYHVLPSHVRKQTGSYGVAFAKHEKFFNNTKADKVSTWRSALNQVTNLSGWDLKQHDGPESEFIEKIVKDVLKKLKHMSSGDHLDGLVGMSSRIDEVDSLLCIGTVDFRIMGIWGMAGVGKTTIARAIFNRIANQFESCCFLANIMEESAKCGLNNLQEKLFSEILEEPNLTIDAFTLNRLCRKKVLIVLDDVNNAQHLKHLVGDRRWFGLGSRIIVTSRDMQVLKNGVDGLYELKELNYHDALQLFSLNAFKQSYPVEEYVDLSNRVFSYAKGNPLALKVLGCFLQGRSKQEWKSLLNKLKRCPNLDIQNVLRLSYDGLDDEEKEIFLDIACFFEGEDKDYVTAILDGYGLCTQIGICVLSDKCLITVTRNKILIHDLIQEMGRNIVLQESMKEPGERSRLWDPQDICNLFKKNTGTKAVESISLDLSQINELHLSSDAFMRMHRLKFLKFYSAHYSKGKKEKDKVHLREGLELLPDELRYLHWHRYPLKCLPSKFDPERLVELQMHHSSVEHLWEENQFNLEKLRRIDLSHSQHLAEIPNLSGASNLQTMVLNGCSSLTKFPQISWNIKVLRLSKTAIEEVPSAIEYLNQLVSLELNYCTRLQNLPSNIRNLTSLRKLSLKGCSCITEFPEISGDVLFLYLDETAIDQVPSSIKRLTKLSELSLKYCTRLERVSSSIFKLQSLTHCILSGCSTLDDLPEVLETKGNLERLLLDRTAIKKLPASIEFLPQLIDLNTGYCKCIESLPNSICNMKSLSSLDLSGCLGVDKMLEDLPLSSSSGLSSLKQLNLSKCNLSTLPSAVSCLPYLKSLNVSGNNFESLSLAPFSCLVELNISHCKRLQSLQEFPLPSNLLDLQAHHCISLETLPTSNVVFTGNWITQQRSIYYNCLKLDANVLVNIMADAQLRIQVMATKARETASLTMYLEDPSFSFCCPGNEIPEWFSHHHRGSAVVIKLPPHWCSTKFLGFALCVVAAFEDCEYFNFCFNCKCYFLTKDDEVHEIVCDIDGMKIDGRLGFQESDHVFLVYAYELSAVFQRDDGEHNLSIYSSCREALFEFSPVDEDLQPIPNCKIKKCGVHLLYLEEETNQISGDDSLNEAGLVESGGDGIQNIVEDEEVPNSTTLEEGTEHKSESEIDTLLLGKSGVKLRSFSWLDLLFFNCCGAVD